MTESLVTIVSAGVKREATVLRDSLCPLFVQPCPRLRIFSPRQIGTSILLRIGSESFMISAAHVLADHGTDILFSHDSNYMHGIGGHVHATNVPPEGRQFDTIDVSVFHLDSEVATKLNDHYKFLTAPDLDIGRTTSETALYFQMGFPVSLSKKSKLGIRGGTFLHMGTLASKDVYTRLKRDPRHHIIVKCDIDEMQNSVNPKRDLDLWGASGGGIWMLHSPFSRNPRAKLVGILTDWIKEEGVVISVKIDLYSELIRHFFPQLRKYIPKSPLNVKINS